MIIHILDASSKLEYLQYWRHETCPPKTTTGFKFTVRSKAHWNFFHPLLKGLDELLQKSNPQYSQGSLQYHTSLSQRAKQSELFPSALSNVQALGLFSTRWVEEGILISKEGSAGNVTVLSLSQLRLRNLEIYNQIPGDEFNKISENEYIIHEDKSLWRKKTWSWCKAAILLNKPVAETICTRPV